MPRAADASAGRRWVDLGVEPGLVPEAAIRFAEREGLRERMYNDLEVGSYLTWDGWPRYRVFQDPRINGYPDEFHAILRRTDLGREEWQGLMDRFGVTSALITYPSVNPRGALFHPARWALVYRDAEALIFARRGPERARVMAAHELPLTFRFDAAAGLVAEALEARPSGAAASACEWSLRLGDFWLETRRGRARAGGLSGGESHAWIRRASARWRRWIWRPATRRERCACSPAYPIRKRTCAGASRCCGSRARRMRSRISRPRRAPAATSTRPWAARWRWRRLHRNDEAIAAFRDFLKRAPTHVGAAEARAHLERIGAPHSQGLPSP